MSNVLQIQEMQHSELGPSAGDRWLNCPGSVLLIRDMENPDSIYAAEGNAAHELSEWCRAQGRSAKHWLGDVIKVGAYEFTVDDEMVDAIDTFVTHVEQWAGDPLIEVRVDYQEWVPGGFGTLDDGRLQPKIARINDLKYGKGVQVLANDNAQLKLYALGVYNDYNWLYGFERFILGIVQPRLDYIDDFEVSTKELLEWANDVVKPTAQIALQPGAPFKAGDHCKFCPARRTCKTRMQYVTEKVFDDFGDLDAAPHELQLLTNDEIAAILPRLDNIKSWCEDLKSHATAEISKGHEVGGYKLVAGRGYRSYTKQAEAQFANKDFMFERKMLSPAQAEKKVGKAKYEKFIAPFVTLSRSPVLAPADDKRKPWAISAEDEFEDLDK